MEFFEFLSFCIEDISTTHRDIDTMELWCEDVIELICDPQNTERL